MTKLFLNILCVAIFLSSAIAQSAGKIELMINSGISLPAGGDMVTGGFETISFSDGWNKGPNFGVALGYSITSIISVNASFDYNKFSLNAENYLAGRSGSVEGGDMSIIVIAANVKLSLSKNSKTIRPYLTAGAGGFKRSEYEITTSRPGYWQSVKITPQGLFQDGALLIGGGLDIPAWKAVDIFLEVKYVMSLVEGNSYIPLKAGLKFRL
ncbi:outer membrane beta-barrel protein [bacterium]|nr:outer membrane beta-barrel protein [bacterium]